MSGPIGGGFGTKLAHASGHITNSQNFETAIGGKWLQVLNEIAPGVRLGAFAIRRWMVYALELVH